MSADGGGKRPSWRENDPKDKTSGDKAKPTGNDPKPEAGANPRFRSLGPKRFQGGTAGKKAIGDDRAPTLLRVLLPATAFALVLLTLGVLLFWLVRPPAARPSLYAWAVTDYNFPIPANPFADRDLKVINASPQLTANTENLQVKQGFDLVFQKIRDDDAQAVVIYLSAHGVSSEGGGYLLHQEATELGQGVPIKDLLQVLQTCRSKNIFVVLDATRIRDDLALGLLGNDFVHHLQNDWKDFERNLGASGQPAKNVWLMVASGEGQIAHFSPALQHTPFGLTVAYCLHGGALADAIDEKLRRADFVLSASEITQYVRDHVATWTLASKRSLQQPVVLRIGDDFPIVPVDRDLTIDRFLTTQVNPPPPPKGKSAPTKEADEKKDDAKDAPKKEEEKPLTAETLLADIKTYWGKREELAADRRSLDRPSSWNLFQQQLMQVELLFLSGRLEAAKNLLERDPRSVKVLVDDLTKPLPTPPLPRWSILQKDESNKEDELVKLEPQITALVDKPDRKAIESFSPREWIETTFLASLVASQLPEDAKNWRSPSAPAAFRARQAAERAVLDAGPEAFADIRRDLEVIDRDRRLQERALRRGLQNTNLFEPLADRYGEARRLAVNIRQQRFELQRLLADLPYLLLWVGTSRPDRDRPIDADQFIDAIRLLREYAQQPSLDRLPTLANRGDDLRRQAIEHARNALPGKRWDQLWPLLRLPFLPTDVRENLLKSLAEDPSAERKLLDLEVKPTPTSTAGELANPYPVASLAPFFDATGSLRAALEPLVGKSLDDLLRDPDLRRQRTAAGREFRQRILERSQATTAPTLTDEAAVRCALGILSPRLAGQAPDADLLRQRKDQQLELLRFQAERLVEDDKSIDRKIRTYDAVEKLIAAAIQKEDSSYRLPTADDGFRLTAPSAGMIEIPSGQRSVATTLSFTTTSNKPESGAVLVLDWDEGLDLSVRGDQGENRHLRVPLASQRTIDVPITVTMATPTARSIGARVERLGGRIDWYSLTVRAKQSETSPAEVFVRRKNSDLDKIDILPNQASELFEILVRQNVAELADLRVDLLVADSMVGQLAVPALKEKQLTALPPEKDFQANLLGGDLTVRLMQGRKKLDEKRIVLEVAVPSQFVTPRFQFKDGRLDVRLTRTLPTGNFRVALEIDDLKIEQSKLVDEIKDKKNEASLYAVLPAGTSRFSASVSVGDVPRAFRRQFSVKESTGTEVREPRLRILQPEERIKFFLDETRADPTLPIALQADGQFDLDGSEAVDITVGVDNNGNGVLDDSEGGEPLRYRNGREMKLDLVADPKAGWVIRSRVRDIQLSIPAAGLRGRQKLIAKLSLNAGNARADREIYFLDECPAIKLDQPRPGAAVEKGQSITALVSTDPTLFGMIDRVRLGFDANGNGQLEDGEVVKPEGFNSTDLRFNNDPSFAVKLSTSKLTAGPIDIVALAEVSLIKLGSPPGVEKRTKTALAPIVVRDPPPPPPPPMPTPPGKEAPPPKQDPMLGKVVGVATRNGVPKPGIKIQIDGVGAAATKPDGSFEIANVPPGKHTVKATGVEDGVNLVGQSEVTVKVNQEAKTEVPLKKK